MFEGAAEPRVAPVPVEPLHYVMPDGARRPGMVTAIGVMSIVVASLGGLYGLVSGLQTLSYYFMSVASAQAAAGRAAAVQARTTGPVTAVSTSVMISPGPPGAPPAPAAPVPTGNTAASVDAAVDALVRRQTMTPARRRHLRAVLAAGGDQIRPDTVREAGTMPPMPSGESPPHYFVTATGRLEVYNDRAVFFPSANVPTIRASAPAGPAPGETPDPPAPGADVPGALSTTAPAAGALSPAEAASVVAQAQAVSGNALNPAQANALTSLLGTAGQQFVQPGASQGSVLATYPQSGGIILVQFADGGAATLGPGGNVLGTTAPPVMPTFSFNPVALAVSATMAVASAALAVFLLVSGILTLRQSPRGRRFHLTWAGLKIPVEIAAAVAGFVVARDMMSSMSAVAGGAGGPTMVYAMVTVGLPALIGLAYPAALLIVLNQKSMREYYGAATSPAV